MVCDRNGEITHGRAHGLFAGDTRVLSSCRYCINDSAWQMLGHSRQDYNSV
jgi:hypothetical protein